MSSVKPKPGIIGVDKKSKLQIDVNEGGEDGMRIAVAKWLSQTTGAKIIGFYLAPQSQVKSALRHRLFNDEVDIILPRNNVLRASDGKWTVDNILRIETDVRSVYTADGNTTFMLAQQVDTDEVLVYVDGVLKSYITDYYIRKESKKLIFNIAPTTNSVIKVVYTDFDVASLKDRKITGVTSGATALVLGYSCLMLFIKSFFALMFSIKNA